MKKFISRRVLSFGIVGVLNTIIDFGILNVLKFVFGLPSIPSNIASTSVAMAFSFLANRRVVFEARTADRWRQASLFFAVTMFGLYVIQTGILYLLIEEFSFFEDLVATVSEALQINQFVGTDFLVVNGAKAIATIGSLLWNYFLYREVVFKKRQP